AWRRLLGPVDQERLLLGSRGTAKDAVAVRQPAEAVEDGQELLGLLGAHRRDRRECRELEAQLLDLLEAAPLQRGILGVAERHAEEETLPEGEAAIEPAVEGVEH